MRALICDIYGTLLDVGPPPPDAEALWRGLWGRHTDRPETPTLDAFHAAVDRHVAMAHVSGRQRGLVQPEVDWPELAIEAFPVLRRLSPHERSAFFFEHARLTRRTSLAAGAADCLRAALARGWVLGIASNAQACTRDELAAALTPHALSLDAFRPEACYHSFLHGRAKPDPHVFQSLTASLAALGVAPGKIVMVGDRLDNDIIPAAAAGWSTWHLRPEPGDAAGPWPALEAWMGEISSS
ncbi:MAG: HAD family hydrolase [Verrucomicrobiales bacterium]